MPEQATAVNGITDKMLKGQPSISTVLPSFAEFCGDALMVAHNALLTFNFYCELLKKMALLLLEVWF